MGIREAGTGAAAGGGGGRKAGISVIQLPGGAVVTGRGGIGRTVLSVSAVVVLARG